MEIIKELLTKLVEKMDEMNTNLKELKNAVNCTAHQDELIIKLEGLKYEITQANCSASVGEIASVLEKIGYILENRHIKVANSI